MLRADETPNCPPHYWVVRDNQQTCKKCHIVQPLPEPKAQNGNFAVYYKRRPNSDRKAQRYFQPTRDD